MEDHVNVFPNLLLSVFLGLKKYEGKVKEFALNMKNTHV